MSLKEVKSEWTDLLLTQITQITTQYNQDMQKSISHNTSNLKADVQQQQKTTLGAANFQLRTENWPLSTN